MAEVFVDLIDSGKEDTDEGEGGIEADGETGGAGETRGKGQSVGNEESGGDGGSKKEVRDCLDSILLNLQLLSLHFY
jgi:hypothetical protein